MKLNIIKRLSVALSVIMLFTTAVPVMAGNGQQDMTVAEEYAENIDIASATDGTVLVDYTRVVKFRYGSALDTGYTRKTDSRKNWIFAPARPSLPSNYITMIKGGTVRINHTGYTKESFDTQDGKKYASVDKEGYIKAKKEGMAHIRYQVGLKEKTLSVNVIDPKVIAVSGAIDYSKSKVNVSVGSSFTISTNMPLNCEWKATENKKISNLTLGADKNGNFVISGKAEKKGSVSIPLEHGRKVFKLKIKIK